ncbi:hypothetical protein ACFL0L_02570 [Patescibacteria group bacterium]
METLRAVLVWMGEPETMAVCWFLLCIPVAGVAAMLHRPRLPDWFQAAVTFVAFGIAFYVGSIIPAFVVPSFTGETVIAGYISGGFFGGGGILMLLIGGLAIVARNLRSGAHALSVS